jgi:hypothetical protein
MNGREKERRKGGRKEMNGRGKERRKERRRGWKRGK